MTASPHGGINAAGIERIARKRFVFALEALPRGGVFQLGFPDQPSHRIFRQDWRTRLFDRPRGRSSSVRKRLVRQRSSGKTGKSRRSIRV
jgi:hypothetical protein